MTLRESVHWVWKSCLLHPEQSDGRIEPRQFRICFSSIPLNLYDGMWRQQRSFCKENMSILTWNDTIGVCPPRSIYISLKHRTFKITSLNIRQHKFKCLYCTLFTSLKVHFGFVASCGFCFQTATIIRSVLVWMGQTLFLSVPTFLSTSRIISVLEHNSPNLFQTPIRYRCEWSDPDHNHNLHADHCPRWRLSASAPDWEISVFLNAYLRRPPRGRVSPQPPLTRQIWESDAQIRHVGFLGGWRGWLEWIMYIITRLSPEHLAKSLKHCSNHNNQSSCCFSCVHLKPAWGQFKVTTGHEYFEWLCHVI